MGEKIISATLQVKTGTSAQDIGNVNKQLGKTTEELEQTNEELLERAHVQMELRTSAQN